MFKLTFIVSLVIICCSLARGDKDPSNCYYDIPIGQNGEIKVKGNLNESMTCTFHIKVNNTKSEASNKTAVHLKELLLDEEDNVVFYLPNKTDVLFGPYHGSMGSFVIFIEVEEFYVNVTTSSKKMIRKFDAYYDYECNIPLSDTPIISAPFYKVKPNSVIDCKYLYTAPISKSRSLVFDQFHLSSKSNLEIDTAQGKSGPYQNVTPPDAFGTTAITVHILLDQNSSENAFTIYNRETLLGCSGYSVVAEGKVVSLKSVPKLTLVNDSASLECRWLIKAETSPTLSIVFDSLEFNSVLDTLLINDGPSEISTPLLIAGRANQNYSKSSVIRTSGQYMWVSFRSLDFSSNFSGNVSLHGQGGYHRGNGIISMIPTVGNDTIFMLEVNANETVILNFIKSDIKDSAKITVYEDFNFDSSLLARLNGNVFAPIVSRTSKMMLLVESFTDSSFTAEFQGIKSGCMHTSPPTSDTYILSGNCNSSCIWTVPPQATPADVVLLQFQYLSLGKNDELQILHLDGKETVATIKFNETHVPQISLSANKGFFVNVTRGSCSETDDVIMIAHTTYPPACSNNATMEPGTQLHIASPNYPDTYPLLSQCQWNVKLSSKSKFIHLTFDKFQLAPNHCLNITQIDGKNASVMHSFSGEDHLRDDLLGGDTKMQFDSFDCRNKSAKLSLISNEGFSITATSADCGGSWNQENGTFFTDGYPSGSNNSNLCIWIIQVPAKDSKKSNYINFQLAQKDNKNSELRVFDGASMRDTEIKNRTGEILSRNYTVLFMYRRLNTALPLDGLNITYRTMECNETMRCGNGLCIHPDWRCNGLNNCGDNTDEINCGNVPISPPPPEKKVVEGIAPVTYGVSIVCFFVLGVVATLGVPYLIQRYRNGRYHQFRDMSEGN